MIDISAIEASSARRTVIEFQGREIEFDEYGYLKDIDLWSEELALFLSRQDNFILMDDHWEVIRLVRHYYLQYRITPMSGLIVKLMNSKTETQKYSIRYLYHLFPGTPVGLACKYAGIPRPSGCR